MQATYVSANRIKNKIPTSSPLLKGVLAGLVALFFALIFVLPAFSTNAANIWCGSSIGAGMETKQNWYIGDENYVLPDNAPRNFGANEIFSNFGFVDYNGEGAGEGWFAGSRAKAGEDGANVVPDWVKTDKSALEGAREYCTIFNAIPRAFANMFLGLASSIVSIAQLFVSLAFSANLVCADPANPTGACLNLMAIIGGKTGASGEGIIGSLTNSLYFPLILIAAVATGVWVAWLGLAKRQVREALTGALWTVCAAFVGAILLLSPGFLTSLPMKASNTLAGCVMGAFNGYNCMDGSGGIGTQSSNTHTTSICNVQVSNASFVDTMQAVVAGVNCNIWKAFVVNPAAVGSWGVGFDELFTDKDPVKGILEKKGLNPDDYCVQMGSNSSVSSQKGGTLQLNYGPKACNLMLYQMALQHDVTLPDGGLDKWANDLNEDTRWYRLVDAANANTGFWSNWSQSAGGGMHKLGVAATASVVSILGVVVMVITALFAMVYYVSCIFLMAFAPVFFLLAVHPGKGKRVFLGWLEKVVSNILKYLASAAFLIVAVSIYGGVLSNLSSFWTTVAFVALITMALLMYRKELIELFGRVNMGGEQLSSRMTDKFKSMGSKAAKMSGAVAGGMVGASLASGESVIFNKKGFGERMQALQHNAKIARSGASDALRRELSSSGGKFIGGIAKGVNRQSAANRSELNRQASAAKSELSDAKQEVGLATNTAKAKRENYNNAEQAHVASVEKHGGDWKKFTAARNVAVNEGASKVSEAASKDVMAQVAKDLSEKLAKGEITQQEYKLEMLKSETHAQNVKIRVENDLKTLGQFNAQAQDKQQEIRIARQNGDSAAVSKLQRELSDIKSVQQTIAKSLGDKTVKAYDSVYSTAMADNTPKNLNKAYDGHLKAQEIESNYQSTRAVLADEIKQADKAVVAAQAKADAAQQKSADYQQVIDDTPIGSVVTGRTLKKPTQKGGKP